jgi:glucose-1-phosphate thymidylyltransferase
MSDTTQTTKAVILARGLGTRMRKAADRVSIDARQSAAADTGVKAMIPIGRPFLDYLLSAVADAGCREACIVIGPEHDTVRAYYADVRPQRLSLAFAVQAEPLGTANAVLAAEAFAGRDLFLVLNSDNYYPPAMLGELSRLGRPGLVGFAPDALVRDGNIDPDRVRKYAVLSVDPEGNLAGIIEKPDEATWHRMGAQAPISMNCWCFGPAIFEASRRIEPSVRGEYEIADAVRYAMTRLGERFRVLPAAAGVLDLSVRADIPSVARRLQNVDVQL